ncbi:MAG: hypothetical protein K9G58_14860 [Bacteroidales bacterium]|nr:hypothetical protein [Bacteroidales bacterium]
MEIKLITLNIWKYYDWKNRKKNAVDFIKENSPEIILFQEACKDNRLKKIYKNQIDEINRELKYPYFSFVKLDKMKNWHKEPLKWKMSQGFGILSKYKLIKSKIKILESVKKTKKSGFAHFRIKIKGKKIDVLNVHFENTDEGSKKQLIEALKWCNKKKIQPIIAGDFNIKDTKEIIEIAKENYYISYLIKQYKSFNPTKFSNNDKPITLDYILAHKSKFKIKKIECSDGKISDHFPIIANIELKG